MEINQSCKVKLDQQENTAKTKEKLKCFVLIPSGSKGEYFNGVEESDYVYNCIIIRAIKRFEKAKCCEVEVVRETDKNTSGIISKNILDDLATADFCIVDITGLNSNVFFELGIRYSLKDKTTILLGQSEELIPFNIKGCRFLEYRCLNPRPTIECLTNYLISGYEEKRTDSLIFETFPEMEVNIPNTVKSVGESGTIASWNDWLDRLKKLFKLLSVAFNDASFVPHVIFGISNGGLIAADLLGRELYRGTPVMSLWANRWIHDMESVDRSCYFFDNQYNLAIINLFKNISGNQKIKILIVDDKLSSGQTILQACAFFKRELKDNYEILYTPLYCKNKEYPFIENNLPFGFNNGTTFNISKNDYYKQIVTNANEISLPYHNIFNQV